MPCVPVCAPLAEPRNAGYPGRPLGSQIAAQSLSAHSHEKAPPERGLSDVPASSDLAHVANAVLVHAVLAGAPGAGDHVSLSLGLEPGDGQGGDLLTRVLTHALFNADHHGLDPRGAVLGDVVSDVHHLQVDLYAGDEIGRAHV